MTPPVSVAEEGPTAEHAAEVFSLLGLIAKSELESPITQLFPPCLEELWVGGSPNKGTARKLARAICLWLKGHWKTEGKDFLTSKGFEVVKEMLVWDGRNTEPLGEEEINKLVFEVIHGSRTSISCDDLKEDLVLGFYCHQSDCYYKRAEDQATTRDIELVDVAVSDDKGRVRFSPDKAADAIINAFEVITTPDRRIWVYNGCIFEPVGEFLIGKILDRVAGDLLSIRALKETLEKVYFRTKEEYSVFDSDPYLFCVENGVIDMRKGHAGFMPHDPKHKRTWKAPVVYDPEARMVEGEKFLDSALDADGKRTFLEILAAKTTCLNFEFFSPWIGRGSNGKSKAQEWIRAFWGDDQVSEAEIAALGKNRFELVELRGKSFLINSEVAGGKAESSWIKHISGGGKLTADQKFKDHISFRSHCFIIFDCNRPPRFDDNTFGFERRIAPVLWPYSFVDEPTEAYEKLRDPDVLEKITTPEELSGLLNVLIEIAPRVIETRTIYRPASGAAIAEAYDMKAASGEIFWERFVDQDVREFVPKAWLYEKYEKFCEIVGASAIRDRDFNKIGRGLDFKEGRDQTPEGYVRGWKYCYFNENAWKEFKREADQQRDQDRPASDQQEPATGPARPARPADFDLIEGEKVDFSIGEFSDFAGLAGPAGPDSDLCRSRPGPLLVPAGPETYLVLEDVPTFTDGFKRWTLKKNDLVSGLPDLQAKILIGKGVIQEVRQ